MATDSFNKTAQSPRFVTFHGFDASRAYTASRLLTDIAKSPDIALGLVFTGISMADALASGHPVQATIRTIFGVVAAGIGSTIAAGAQQSILQRNPRLKDQVINLQGEASPYGKNQLLVNPLRKYRDQCKAVTVGVAFFALMFIGGEWLSSGTINVAEMPLAVAALIRSRNGWERADKILRMDQAYTLWPRSAMSLHLQMTQ